MHYISTRAHAPAISFEQTLLAGLAVDGGLYMPSEWPQFTVDDIASMRGLSYAELTARIIERFVGGDGDDGDNGIDSVQLAALCKRAYENFDHSTIAPLKPLDDSLYVLELFHGPTLAFKDFALQLLGQLFAHYLTRQRQTRTIIGATSGDTGSAAICALRGLDAVTLFMLHPHGRVSEVQRKQMTTVQDANIINIAVDGVFDDCQNLVKALFNDAEVSRTKTIGGGQLDKLGAHRRTNRILFLRGGTTRRTKTRNQLRRAKRQLRQCIRRLGRARNGAADHID